MDIIKKHRAYFSLYFPLLIIVGYIVFAYSKGSIHLYFNEFHTPFFDYFFKYITYLGDGIPVVIISLLYLFFINTRQGLLLGLSAILSTTITQIFKQIVFGSTPRPLAYFNSINDEQILYLVDGVKMHVVNSLPSGHTTVAFAITISIAFIYSTRRMDYMMLILGALIGWSRVYLSQHFLQDVFMGSIIGILGAIVIYSIFYSPKMLENKKLDKSLLNLIRQ